MTEQATYLIKKIRTYLNELEHEIGTQSKSYELTDKTYNELLKYEAWSIDNKLPI